MFSILLFSLISHFVPCQASRKMRNYIFLVFIICATDARKEPRKHVRTISDRGNTINIEVENTVETDRYVTGLIKVLKCSNDIPRCYQYTWVGVEESDMNQNGTGSFPSCMDLESDVSMQYAIS